MKPNFASRPAFTAAAACLFMSLSLIPAASAQEKEWEEGWAIVHYRIPGKQASCFRVFSAPIKIRTQFGLKNSVLPQRLGIQFLDYLYDNDRSNFDLISRGGNQVHWAGAGRGATIEEARADLAKYGDDKPNKFCEESIWKTVETPGLEYVPLGQEPKRFGVPEERARFLIDTMAAKDR